MSKLATKLYAKGLQAKQKLSKLWKNESGEANIIAIILVLGGLFLAWVSSFLLYGFGELIERTASIDAKLQSQKKRDSLTKNDTKETKDEDFASVQPKKAFMNVANNAPKKMCPHCGELISKNICDMCGQKNNLFSK